MRMCVIVSVIVIAIVWDCVLYLYKEDNNILTNYFLEWKWVITCKSYSRS
jgi:hypothetical protein